MTWHDLPADPTSGVLCTITKKEVTLRLGAPLLRQMGWDENLTAVLTRIGAGDNDGWIRLEASDFGTTGGEWKIPRSTLPAVPGCKDAPLLFKIEEDAIEVQLPLPTTRAGNGAAARRPVRPGQRAPAHTDNRPKAIHTAPPTKELAELRQDLAMRGTDLEYYKTDDGVIATWNNKLIEGMHPNNESEIRSRASVVFGRSDSPGDPASP